MAEPDPKNDEPLPPSMLTRILDEMLTTLAESPDVPDELVASLRMSGKAEILTSPESLRYAIRSATKGPPR